MNEIYIKINVYFLLTKTKICEWNAKESKDNNHSVYVHTMTMLFCYVERNLKADLYEYGAHILEEQTFSQIINLDITWIIKDSSDLEKPSVDLRLKLHPCV